MKACELRTAYPLFGGSGEVPTSPRQLAVGGIPFPDAKKLNALWHSRLPRFGTGCVQDAGYLCYGAECGGTWYGVAIWSNPVARLLPQHRWLELRRLAIAPDAPRNTASFMLGAMARLIQRDRPEVARLISYQDTDVHTGGIYRAAGWRQAFPRKKSNTQWNMPGRPRPESQSDSLKQRWEKIVAKEIKWVELNPTEKKRTYHFPGGEVATFENVVRIEIRDSGNHRIETADGRKAFVRPEWLWVDIDTPEWSA